jgi:ketosteroid isomerase-like protein
MSEDDQVDATKLAESLTEAMNRFDPDAVLALVDPEIEFHSRLAALPGHAYKGRQGLRDYFRDVGETFADPRWEVDEIVGWQGGDLVLVIRTVAQGRESGLPIDSLTSQVWSFREGKLWRVTTYRTKAEALEAVGLSE